MPLTPRKLTEVIRSFGIISPLVFISLNVVQIVLAPIPGHVFGFLGGYLFGTFYGILYTMIGVTIGSYIAFYISKRFGRPFVEDILDESFLRKFDDVLKGPGTIGIFILFLIPGLPDDVLCFIAGISEMRTWKFLTIVVLGRTPAFFLVNLSGSQIASGSYYTGIVLLVFISLASVIFYLKRKSFMRAVENIFR
ncbi:MAG: TVP38/TMEM64 family protein [Candidatus Aenigmatarchaeota archaeon]